MAAPAVAVALCAIAACAPGLPSDLSGSSELQIRGTTLLMPASSGRLTAWEPAGEGHREVRATWTAEGDAVSIAGDGTVTAMRIGRSVVRAQFEHRTGSKTVHVVGSMAGVWRGSITVVDCKPADAFSPDPCPGRHGLTGLLVLDVAQSASAETFNLQAGAAIFTPPAAGTLTGAVNSDGMVHLAGRVERQADSLSGLVAFEWRLENDRLVPSVSGLTENILEVELSLRIGSSTSRFHEFWELSPLVRSPR
jgi:hypothetical protein